ncbi:MAG: hypothetical protein H6559_24760 [Lewinellaceae bacterium]|nr:hypothetical protein [Lewinellaceae bacterium]
MKAINPYLRQLKTFLAKSQEAEALADVWQWLYDHQVSLDTIEAVIGGRHWEWITESEDYTHLEIREFKQLTAHYENKRLASLLA